MLRLLEWVLLEMVWSPSVNYLFSVETRRVMRCVIMNFLIGTATQKSMFVASTMPQATSSCALWHILTSAEKSIAIREGNTR